MSSFTLLWSRILDSSVWQESKETRLVWITMLAMKDKDGMVMAAAVGLAARARVSLAECQAALEVFKKPDPHSSNPADGGRRIREVPGGWQIINADFYRCSTDARREFWRESKARQRERKKTKPLPGEVPALAAEARGDLKGAEAIAGAALPEADPDVAEILDGAEVEPP